MEGYLIQIIDESSENLYWFKLKPNEDDIAKQYKLYLEDETDLDFEEWWTDATNPIERVFLTEIDIYNEVGIL